jgi:hypothetical protein
MGESLYKLTGEYAALQARIEDGEDVTAELEALNDALEVKAERIAFVLRSLSADQEVLAAEEKRLATRRKSLERAEESLREYIRANMAASGIKRIKCPAFTFSLSERENLVVVDEDSVPFDYLKTTTAVDKVAVNAAYKRHGELVAGCELRTTHVLTIK